MIKQKPTQCNKCTTQLEIIGNRKSTRFFCPKCPSNGTGQTSTGNGRTCHQHDTKLEKLVITPLQNEYCSSCLTSLLNPSSNDDGLDNGKAEKTGVTALCKECGTQMEQTEIPTQISYRCDQCNAFTSVETRNGTTICKKHDCEVQQYINQKRTQWHCKSCGKFTKPLMSSERTKQAQENLEQVLPTLKRVVWDRKVQYHLDRSDPQNFLNELLLQLKRYDGEKTFEKFKEYLLPSDVMEQIVENTGSDVNAEKTHLINILMWGLCFFLQKNKGDLTFKGISGNSSESLPRRLTGNTLVSNNALGVRMEKEEVVEGLEETMQLTSEMLGSRAFEGREDDDQSPVGYVPLYYDWFYIVKNGTKWKLCKDINDDSFGIKVGIARDWETQAIVGLTAHFTEHPGDREAFQHYLMYSGRDYIIHVTDGGPFAVPLLKKMDDENQFFIIPKRSDITTELQTQELGSPKEIELNDRHTIKLLEINHVTIKTKEVELESCKELYFRINGNEGEFEYVRLLTNLEFDSDRIIKIGYPRWRATETEHRILKHEFGLEHIYLQKPEKFWPLLLLALISSQLLKLCYRLLHKVHGGKLTKQPKKFRKGFLAFLNAIFHEDDEPWKELPPCDSPTCPFGRSHGERR